MEDGVPHPGWWTSSTAWMPAEAGAFEAMDGEEDEEGEHDLSFASAEEVASLHAAMDAVKRYSLSHGPLVEEWAWANEKEEDHG